VQATDGLVEMVFAGTANGDQGLLGVWVCVSRLDPAIATLAERFSGTTRERD
jgi:hypothetical protein